MEERYRLASQLAWRLRQSKQPLLWEGAPPDGRFFLEAGQLALWEWRLVFPPMGRPVVAIDLETTGFYPQKDGVTEIALVRMEEGQKSVFQSFVNPGRPIPPRVQALTGITNEDVADAPPLPEVLETVRPYLEDAVWVFQNAPFDLGFLTPVLRRVGFKMEFKVVDTLRLARKTLPGLRSYRLSNLARVFAWPGSRYHRALTDAEATLWVAHELYYLRARGRAIPLEEL